MTLQFGDIVKDIAADVGAYDFAVDGLAVLPHLFAPEEAGWLAAEAQALTARLSGRPRPQLPVRHHDEAPDGTLFDVDVYEEPFRRLVAHPRLLAPVRRQLSEPLYVHRTRLIGAAPAADTTWRRDFPIWQRIAGMAAPRLLTALVCLGDAGAAPRLFVRPGSHVRGETPAVALPVPQGSVVLLHGNLAYALADQAQSAAGPLFLVTYNTMANQPVASAWVGAGSFRPRPLESVLSDDCLWPPAFACAG